MTDIIYQDDHELFEITLNGVPTDGLSGATVEFYLSKNPYPDDGEHVLKKTDASSDVTITNTDGTVEVNLQPADTDSLPVDTLYPTITVTINGDESTTALSPNLEVKPTAHDV